MIDFEKLTPIELLELSDIDRNAYFQWLELQKELQKLHEEEKAKKENK